MPGQTTSHDSSSLSRTRFLVSHTLLSSRRRSTNGPGTRAPRSAGRQRGAQLGGVHADVVGRRSGLEATTLGERADIDRVEAELIDQLADHALGLRVVTGDGERAPVRRTRRPALGREVLEVDGVERLDDTRIRQMCREQLAARGASIVELGDLAVTRGV